MKKPWWIRAFGWVAAGMFMVAAVLGAGVAIGTHTWWMAGTAIWWFSAGLVPFSIWLGFTLIWKFIVVMLHGQAQATPSTPSPMVLGCQECVREPATFHCVRHELNVCDPCARSHFVAGECGYIPLEAWLAGKPRQAEAAFGRRAAGRG